VGGAGVARGYLNQPELTREKFIFSPNFLTSSLPNFPLYRTGDRARWLADGNIEYLGREDSQVKLRGFRVELAEIERQLLRHGDIGAAAAVCKQGPDGDKYICAYIAAGREFPVSELRAYLAGYLPDYMMPSYFVQLEKIPLSPNGKVDKKALPDPGAGEMGTYAGPRDTVEARLVNIWSEVLGRDETNAPIGIDDNFFQCGGHSLKATVLVARVHRELDVKIPLAEIFTTPTIRGMSAFIAGLAENKHVGIGPAEEKEYYPLSPVQKRMYVVQQMQSDSKSYNLPAVLVLSGPLRREKLTAVFQRLIARHDILRTSFQIIKGEAVQVIHKNLAFEIEFYESDEDRAREITDHFWRAFDLSRVPLLRVGLIKIGENEHILMVDMHHITADGVSQEIMRHEFISLYNGVELPALKMQYKDFSEWHNRLLAVGEMARQREYWLGRFKNGVPVLNIPVDYPRPAVRDIDAGDHVSFSLAAELGKKIHRVMENTNVTVSMMLLAIYNILWSGYTRQEDIVTGVVITGRAHADLENVIGMFVNTLPIRNYPARNKTFREFLAEVRDHALGAFENQDYPFDELVIDLGLQGAGNRNPLFDVVFNFNNITRPEATYTDLQIKPYRSEFKFAKFDFGLYAGESGETIHILFRYSTQLFKADTVEKLKKYFIEITAQVVDNIDIKLKDITLSHDFAEAKSSVHHENKRAFNL
ncbi:MAG TPA: condensation domain-containing protein, partial [Candidatus Deferrimicrobium sp.]|nr:condensation domain-containing protein [Candidatus Deferrimicrobium sp.]